MMQALAGHDPTDPASADRPVPDYRAALVARLDGLRIGVIRPFHERDAVAGFGPENAPSAVYIAAFDAACRTLQRLGAGLAEVKLSPLVDYLDANRLIMLAEAYALHEKDFRERPQDFGRLMFARVGLGAFLSAADYVEATRQRRELCREFVTAFAGIDVMVAANATGPAPPIDALPLFGVYERASYTGPFNLTGSPRRRSRLAVSIRNSGWTKPGAGIALPLSRATTAVRRSAAAGGGTRSPARTRGRHA